VRLKLYLLVEPGIEGDFKIVPEKQQKKKPAVIWWLPGAKYRASCQ
jgi:hypothetical protein